ncbi:MAG TPA: hypothetical protein V6C95_22000 [Coleofasciculaceae cyanobacterium]|jgi:hypothetical protein
MKRGRGRPKGSGEKHENLTIRLTPKDKEKLQKYAGQKKITITEAIERFINGLDVEPEEP